MSDAPTRFDRLYDNPRVFLFARISGHLFLAALCLLVPTVGAERFTLAALIIFGFLPAALVIARVSGQGVYNPLDNYLDLVCVCIGAFLSPDNWHVIVMIAIILSQAPVLTVHDRGVQRFVIAYTILLTGLSAAGFYHQVPGWPMAMAIIAILAPGVIFMSQYQTRIANDYRARATAHDSVRLVAGGVAHDFNNILTSVLVNAEMALDSVTEDSEAHLSLHKVIDGTERASLLSEQLLSLSGRSVTEPQQIDLGQEISGVASLVQTLYPADCTMNVEIDDQRHLTVFGDRSRLQQVFINLLINAADESTTVTVRVRSTEEHVIVSVQDYGRGIDPNVAARMFDPYFSQKTGGRGMGLAAVRQVVSDHRGTINFSVNPGHGAEFVVSIPKSQELEEQPAPTAERISDNTTILIAEDEPALLELMGKMVDLAGFQPRLAEDGPKFCSAFDRFGEEARMVVLDLKMPGCSGWECLSHIRLSNPTLPVLIVSGFDPQKDPGRIEDPFVSFLRKPFTMEDFLGRLPSRGTAEELENVHAIPVPAQNANV